jgi:hypothetical protein
MENVHTESPFLSDLIARYSTFDLVLANSRYVIGSWNLQHMNDNRFYRFCFALMLAWLLTSKASSFLALSHGSMI